jgi:hypothetical protein
VSDSVADVDPVIGGALVARLLCGPSTWMRRRKLHVTFIDDVALRLRLSVDFCVPDEVTATAQDERGTEYVHLPLFLLRKARQELLDFDLEDATGKALSLPTRQHNAEISYQGLLACAAKALGLPQESVATARGMPIELMKATAYDDPPDSLDTCDELLEPEVADKDDRIRARLAADRDFRFFARLISWSSIVVLPIPLSFGERLIKLSYSEPIEEWKEWGLRIRAGIDPLPARIDLPFVGGQTFHLEAHPPVGMAVERGVIGVRTREGSESKVEEGSGRAMHLYLPGLEQGRSGAAFFFLRAQKGGFMENARAACAAVAAVLVLSVIIAPQLAKANATVPTLMLFLPGLLATIVLQPTAHALTHHVLAMIRNAVLLCAVLAYLAALWLVAAPSEQVRTYARVPVASVSTEAPARQKPDSVRRTGEKRQPVGVKARSGGGPADTRNVETVERSVLVQTSSRPSAGSLRVGWGVLAVFAIAALGLTSVARSRARA